MTEATDIDSGEGAAHAAPAPRRSRARTLVLLALVLACFGGGFWAGHRLTSGMSVPYEAVAEAPAEAVATDLGRFALHLPGALEPRVVKITARIFPGQSPQGEAALRDAVHELIVAVVEMPLVSAEAVTNEGIAWAVMAIAPQEAPWLDGITLSDLQAMPS